MKKGKFIMLCLCFCFFSLVIGMFLGRNTRHEYILLPSEETSMISEQSADPRLDLNEMSKAQLMSLPGIGELLADRIVAYRDQYGPFQSIDELLMVEGIGEVKIERISPFVFIGG